ncbi:MAG TPA: aspartate kinase [Chloroflexia bacterium]|nr:aspartate kinase [Chloroflexia bacterium]
MLVMKFGGTSVGSAARIRQVATLVQEAAGREPVVVVVSAVSGVTDGLIAAARDAAGRQRLEALQRVIQLQGKHAEILYGLDLPAEMQQSVADELHPLWVELENFIHSVGVLGELTRRTLDYISSLGERLSCRLVAATLRAAGQAAEAVDATRVVVTDSTFGNAFPLMDATRARATAVLAPLLAAGRVPVITGFIGANADGIVTTLGRGGSDYSAAILGRALDAREVIIWTDVDGVMTANPRVVPEARTLPQLSYLEAAEMSYFGAKVLHPKTIAPAVEGGIPVRIKNTFAPESPGTLITAQPPPADASIRAITAISRLALLTLQGKGMVGLPGVAARLFSTIAQEGINVLMISQSSSEYNICVLIEEAYAAQAQAAIERQFALEQAQGLIEGQTVRTGVSIVAVIGAGMRGKPAVTGQVFLALAGTAIEVLAIAQGSSELNLSFVIASTQEDAAVRAIHQHFDLGR